MKVTFVGHAGVLLEDDDVALLADPWLVGDAFNDSWAPYPQPLLREEALARVTHVWFSHEHPDHLSIPTLRSIPPERRAGITALYQRHWSPEVVGFLRALGFAAVVELVHGAPVVLGDDVEVCLLQVGHEDSALLVRTPAFTALDLNDCKPTPAALDRLARATGPVDLLLNQFSIAGWPGNPGDDARLAAASRRSLDELVAHVEAVRPRWVLPFASFVRFCHEENAYMNEAVNTLDDVVETLGRDRLVVLYPGDEWDTSEPFAGTDEAIARYRKDHAATAEQPLRASPPRSFEEIAAAARERVAELERRYHRTLLRRVRPVTFRITDLDRSLVLDVAAGAVTEDPAAEGRGGCTVEVGSQAAWYTFAHRWGLTTLLISGRLRISGDERAFTRLKQLGAVYSSGMYSRGVLKTVASPRVASMLARRWRNLWSDFAARAA